MKSRVQHDDDDDIGTNLVKQESIALTVESERYIPLDSVRPRPSVPSSVHLGTSCKLHPQSTSNQPSLYGNRSKTYLETMRERLTRPSPSRTPWSVQPLRLPFGSGERRPLQSRPCIQSISDLSSRTHSSHVGLDGRLTDDGEEEQEKEDRADRIKVPDDPVVLSGHVDVGWLWCM
jgi:hypothetical protein